jgi:propanol-preferring alcohol dehydrogenase
VRAGIADYLGRIPKDLSFVDAASILCAGVTTYKGLKETNARPGRVGRNLRSRWPRPCRHSVFEGHGTARRSVDVRLEKMALARNLGAEISIDAKTQDPPTEIQKAIGGDPGGSGNGGFNHCVQAGGRHVASRRNVRAGRSASG